MKVIHSSSSIGNDSVSPSVAKFTDPSFVHPRMGNTGRKTTGEKDHLDL